jgi:hypothetical protein
MELINDNFYIETQRIHEVTTVITLKTYAYKKRKELFLPSQWILDPIENHSNNPFLLKLTARTLLAQLTANM